MSRITPDAEKNHFDVPMKSKRIGFALALRRRRAPTGARAASSVPSVPTIACVNRTAVNSETMVPTPSVNAKPLTPAVASTNRMNATMIVTTFASMIAAEALAVAGGEARGHRSAARGSPP